MSFVTCKTILIHVFLNNINVNHRFILEIRQFFIVNEFELENIGKLHCFISSVKLVQSMFC